VVLVGRISWRISSLFSFFFSSRRRHTRSKRDWSSDVCSSDLTIAGSFVEIILSRFIKPLTRFFPPLITGTVVALIGITLLPVSMDWAAGGVGASDYGSLRNLTVAFAVMVFTLFLNHFGKGIWSTASVFIGMIVGYIICIPLGMVDLTEVYAADWIALPSILHYGVHFDLA